MSRLWDLIDSPDPESARVARLLRAAGPLGSSPGRMRRVRAAIEAQPEQRLVPAWTLAVAVAVAALVLGRFERTRRLPGQAGPATPPTEVAEPAQASPVEAEPGQAAGPGHEPARLQPLAPGQAAGAAAVASDARTSVPRSAGSREAGLAVSGAAAEASAPAATQETRGAAGGSRLAGVPRSPATEEGVRSQGTPGQAGGAEGQALAGDREPASASPVAGVAGAGPGTGAVAGGAASPAPDGESGAGGAGASPTGLPFAPRQLPALAGGSDRSGPAHPPAHPVVAVPDPEQPAVLAFAGPAAGGVVQGAITFDQEDGDRFTARLVHEQEGVRPLVFTVEGTAGEDLGVDLDGDGTDDVVLGPRTLQAERGVDPAGQSAQLKVIVEKQEIRRQAPAPESGIQMN